MYSFDWRAIRGGIRNDDDGYPLVDAGTTSRWALPKVDPVVWSLGYTSLLTDVSSEMVSSILPIYLLLHLHVSPAAFGLIDGLYQGFAVLVRIAAGFVGDRWQRHKAVATFGYALSAVCRLGILAVGSAWTGIAFVVAADRTGKGIRTAPRDAMIALATPATELARAFGVHRALDAAGAMIGPLIAFLALSLFDDSFDVIFVLSFCVAVIGVGVLVLFVDDRAPREASSESHSVRSALGLFAQPGLRRVAIAAALLSVATVSDAFIFLSLQRQTEFGAGLFPLLFVAVSLVNFALSTSMGQLADRLGRGVVFLGGHAFLLIAYVLLALPSTGLASTALCLMLLGGYYAATDGVLAALTGAALPRELCGSGLSIIASVTNLGRLVASVVFGVAWAWWGLQPAILLFIVGLACALAGAAIVLRLPLLRFESTRHA